jgi:hypothetical protein
MFLTLLQSFIQPTSISQIYQEVWIIEDRKPKKREERAKRRVKIATCKIEESLKEVKQLAVKRELDEKRFAQIKASIEQESILIELQYKVLDAELRLLDVIEAEKERTRRSIQQRVLEIEQILAQQRAEEELKAAERTRKEQEELEDLSLLFNFLLRMD